jgi:hypothetical protein
MVAWRRVTATRRVLAPRKFEPMDCLMEYGRVCAELLAKGHARSGDPALLADDLGRQGKAEKRLLQFAVAYADPVEKDYEAFL